MARMRSIALVAMVTAGSFAVLAAVLPPRSAADDRPKDDGKNGFPPALTLSGGARERGLAYGKHFRDGIREFLDEEIYKAFVNKPASREEMLRYAADCRKVVRDVCPVIADELDGIAEGSGLKPEEVVLINLHEELYHRAPLPKQGHCTAVAVAPPDTGDRHTYVGQTWDWMASVAGKSAVTEWRRDGGVSVLAYGFPGMPVGAGVNSAGIALCWTSAALGEKGQMARVGVPSYTLIQHLLSQKDVDAVIREAKRDKHAGWFTFVMADGEGHLVNIEGSPKGVEVERSPERLIRIGYGTRAMAAPAGGAVKLHPRCEKMAGLLEGSAGKNGREALQRYFAEPANGISVGKSTIDMMVFDTTARTAYLSRGPSYRTDWREFTFSASK